MAATEDNWRSVVDFMQRRCGVALSSDQSYLLASRLDPLAKQLAFASTGKFVQEACRGGDSDKAVLALIDAMTTHESYFFRDTPFWEVFEASRS